MEGDAFQRHLHALGAAYEQVLLENMELRKHLANTPHDDKLWQLSQSGSVPPLPPATTVSTMAMSMNPASLARRLPGALLDPNELEPEGGTGSTLDGPGEGEAPVAKLGTPPATPPPPASTPPPMASPAVRNNGKSTRTTRRSSFLQALRQSQEEESEDDAFFLLMLDVVPAVVILISAVVAGFSADIEPDHAVWIVLEFMFTLFFMGEIIVKLRVFGCKEYMWGQDWYWSWFDILCVILAFVDMGLTFSSLAEGAEGGGGGILSILKMLKLARLGRIVRLLKFKIFTELKLMIQGVFTGLRVLFWAVVLLVGCMYLLGVVTKTIFHDKFEEFRTVPAAMFTSFRCFTDGCAAIDGTPLHEQLRKEFGGLFMFAYILLFLFVTIGIFNLIMAVFIDNVTDGSTKKRQRELGQNAPKTAFIISDALRQLILTNILRKEAEDEAAEMEKRGRPRRVSKILKEKVQGLKEMYGYKPHSAIEYDELTSKIREEMSKRNIVVTREEFNHWLHGDKNLLETLDDSEIDLSCSSAAGLPPRPTSSPFASRSGCS